MKSFLGLKNKNSCYRIIKVKYHREPMQSVLAGLLEEITADASLYLSHNNSSFDKIIVFIWHNKVIIFTEISMVEIENGRPVCLPHRKSAVRDLYISKAHTQSVIKYQEVYKIFEEDKDPNIAQLTWRGCVWETVEDVCKEIATLQGAIYYSMLSNRNNVPEDVFWESFISHRKEQYEKDTNILLSYHSVLTLEQKISIANYERERVYRHANKYYKK
jgi:hypothetical protein